MATITSEAFVSMPGASGILGNSGPHGLAFDSNGDLYVSYFDANKIVKISNNKTISDVITSGLSAPTGLVFDSSRNLYCVNYTSNTIVKFNTNLSTVNDISNSRVTISTSIGGVNQLSGGVQLNFDSLGNLYCASRLNNRILKITPSNSVSLIGTISSGAPYGLAIDPLDNIYVSLINSAKIMKITPNGTTSEFTATGLVNPRYLKFDSIGNLYCTDLVTSDHRVVIITPNGTATKFISGAATIFNNPMGLDFDSSSNLYVANYGSKTIRKINITKIVTNLSNFTNINKLPGDANFNLSDPSSNSPGAFTFSSSNSAVATISGRTVTIVGVGETTITATQAETTDYRSASITATLQVGKNTTTLGVLSNINKTFGDASFNLSNPSSDSSGAFSYDSSNTSVATISGNTVTIVGAGTTTITATQAETSTYNSASTSFTLTVAKGTPSLGVLTNINKTFGDASFSLSNPSSNSSGAFSYDSSNIAVATISGNNVTIVGAGTTTITATQAETANYNGASTTATLTVAKANPRLANFSNINKTFGNIPFILNNPSSDSSGAFDFITSDRAVATIQNILGNIVITIVGAGTTTITALQAETANYTDASINLTLNVLQNSQSNPASINDLTDLLYFVKTNAPFAVLSSDVNVFTDEWITGNSLKLVRSNGRVLVTRRDIPV